MLIVDTVNKQKILQLVSWLVTKRELGVGPRTNPLKGCMDDLNMELPDFKSRTLKHSATLPFYKGFVFSCIIIMAA